MSASVQLAISDLCRVLMLDIPASIDSLFTLQVGDHVVYMTEQPAQQLLMFCCIAPQPEVPVLQQNLFSDHLLKPVIAQSEQSQDWVIWNRQPLADCDAHTLQQQLELLSECVESNSQFVVSYPVA